MNNPKGLISPNEAQTLNDAYTTRCELVSSKITNRPDNRSSWYSLEDLKTFLTLAEAQAKDLGYTMDGVRIYCGAYPTVKGQAGYSTSFIIPTSANEKDGGGSNDIPGANGLNIGSSGNPPNANYPQ